MLATLFLFAALPTGVQYLDNGRVKLGVDLDKGGAIVWLSKEHGPNIVNDYDLGRQIQMSYYSGPVPFTPGGKQPLPSWASLGWNPIQTGDCYRHPSKTVSFKAGGNHLRLTCIPMQWPLDNEPGECTFTADVRLVGDTV